MQDRELLELAAKAAGYNVRWHEIWQCFVHVEPFNTDNPPTPAGQRLIWVPLSDDGDALRLAVKLGMRVSVNRDPAGFTAIASVQSPFGAKSATESADPETLPEATRRAIVRAAAEIGKNR